MKVDWLVVGAGFTGAVLAERIASQLEQKVLVIDRRKHIAGNAFDSYDEHGILVHRYGPHIFHTNSERVWTYLSQFTPWRLYHHKQLAQVEGNLVPIPFNLNAIQQIFSRRLADRLEEKLLLHFGHGARVPILRLRENDDPDLRFLADYVYKNVFEGYTKKQWGVLPEELDPSVTARVPVVVSRDDRYFADRFQGIPKYGYTRLFERMLSHANIKIGLGVAWGEAETTVTFKRAVFTGPIDEFFDFCYGRLPYRSLRFVHEHQLRPHAQPAGVVTYPSEQSYTRTTEFKWLTGQVHPATTIAYEYPQPYVQFENEPYYPIPAPEHRELYERYRSEATKRRSIIFAGRLADYKYYNMDQAVARALAVFAKEVVT